MCLDKIAPLVMVHQMGPTWRHRLHRHLRHRRLIIFRPLLQTWRLIIPLPTCRPWVFLTWMNQVYLDESGKPIPIGNRRAFLDMGDNCNLISRKALWGRFEVPGSRGQAHKTYALSRVYGWWWNQGYVYTLVGKCKGRNCAWRLWSTMSRC